jgi:hypothetical protein
MNRGPRSVSCGPAARKLAADGKECELHLDPEEVARLRESLRH